MPLSKLTLLLSAFTLMLGEADAATPAGQTNPLREEFGPLLESATQELHAAATAQISGLPYEIKPLPVPADLEESVQLTGARCAILAARRKQYGSDDPIVVAWSDLVMGAIDDIAGRMREVIVEPGAVGDASE